MEWVRFVLSIGAVTSASYVCGATPWGFLIGKFNGLDLRKHGSGNIGATNVRRVLGGDWGVLCFILDFLKGLVPVLVAGYAGAHLPVGAEFARLAAAGGAVCGHVWPFWLRFRGGKGVATTIGALLAVAWISVAAALVAWLVVFYSSRYVSLASLCAALMLPVSHALAPLVSDTFVLRRPTLLLLVALSALIIWRHRGNLRRLLQGTEYRFGSNPGGGKAAASSGKKSA